MSKEKIPWGYLDAIPEWVESAPKWNSEEDMVDVLKEIMDISPNWNIGPRLIFTSWGTTILEGFDYPITTA